MKKYKRSFIAASMAAMLMIAGMTGCTTASAAMRSYPAAAQTQESETEDTGADELAGRLQDAASDLLKDQSQKDGKTETVYIVAGTDGTAKETIVSSWLKNPEGLDVLEDVSELEDITNTKGDETFTKKGTKLTWQADGKDIWYQGKTDKQLPITTKISYELDGKKVTADELAGKDGHLKITYSYENHVKAERKVDGEKVTMYQPFSVVSGFLADSSKMSDLTVSRGKIISTGDYTIVLGMAFPGLEESLGLDKLEDENGEKTSINIPEEVVIEGDVHDFSLTTSITVFENTLLDELNLDDVTTLEDLEDKMTELSDGSQKLADGSKDLSDGAGTLNDGAKQLDEGAGKLEEGAVALAVGAGQLDEGANTLNTGAKALYAGISAAQTGAKQLTAGIKAADEGAAQLAEGAESLDEGADRLSQGASQLNAGVGNLKDGTGALSTGANALDAGIGELASRTADLPAAVSALSQGAGKIQNAVNGPLLNGAHSLTAGAQAISSNMDNIKTGIDQISAGLSAVDMTEAENALSSAAGLNDQAAQAAASLMSMDMTGMSEAQIQTIQTAAQTISQCAGGSTQYIQGVGSALGTAGSNLGTAVQGLDNLSQGVSELKNGADSLAGGAEELENGIRTLGGQDSIGALAAGLARLETSSGALTSGISSLKEGSAQVASGAGQVDAGAGQLQNGSSQLAAGASDLKAGTSELSEGASNLKTGTAQLASGADELSDGADKLVSGASDLKDGTDALASGADDLAEGADTLRDGTKDLKTGTAELAEGTQALLDGAMELMDGMQLLNDEGIQKLSELLGDDAETFVSRLKELQHYSESYTNFTGASKDCPCSVRFIMRTEAIGKN